MIYSTRWCSLLGGVLGLMHCGAAADTGKNITNLAAQRWAFPPSMKVEDVKTQFGLKGDGVTDDTAALQAAINRQRAFVYLPNGTYLVRSRLIYDQKVGIGPTIIGESRDGVVIKLAEDAKGFDDPAQPRELLRMVIDGKVSADFFKTRVRNLTLDTGKHRGAVGVCFYANNNGHLRNVRIVGQGVVGLDLSHELNGPLLVSHLVIDGFDIGILAGSGPYNSQTLEHIALRGQREWGIKNEGECLSIRGLLSVNTCPALLAGGNTVLVEADLRGGAAGHAAIITGGGLFARDVMISPAYGRGIQGHEYHWKTGLGAANEVVVGTGMISEWLQKGAVRPLATDGAGAAETLRLPIVDTPIHPPSAELTQWVCVDDFGADGTDLKDDTAAIKAAIAHADETGKSVLCFAAQGTYFAEGTFDLGGSIQHVIGAASYLSPVKDKLLGFRLVDGPAHGLTFDLLCRPLNPNITVTVENASSRDLVVRCLRSDLSATGPGRCFVEDACGRLKISHPQARVWVRQLNSEAKEAQANENRSGTLWVLGMKSERTPTLIGTYAGGSTEVLGTWAYVISKTAPENPLWIVDDARASFAGIIQWHNQRKFYDVLVREIHDGKTHDFTIKGNGGSAPLPLYRTRD
jgi:hypothetical protein